MFLLGEHKTKEEAEKTLKKFQESNPEQTFRVVPNECGGKPEFAYLVQVKDERGWLCLHD